MPVGRPNPGVTLSRRRSGFQAAITIGVLALALWYASHLTSWNELIATIGGVSRTDAVLIGVVASVNLATYWAVLAAAVPGLGLRRAAAVQLPATALANVAPAGGALGTTFVFVKLRAWGHTLRSVAAAMLVNGILNFAAKISVAVIAVAVTTPTIADGGGAPVLAVVALVACVVGVIALASSRAAAERLGGWAERAISWVRGLLGRPPVTGFADRAAQLQRDIGTLVRERRVALVAATLASHVTLFLLFLQCVRGVGIDAGAISTAELLGAFAVARLVSLVPLTPGGIGVIELSLAASLTATGGDTDLIVGAIALYRGATYVLPSLLGLVVLAGWALVARTAPHADRSERPFAEADRSRPLVVDLDGTLLPVTSRTIMLARLAWRSPAAVVEYRRRRGDRLGSKLLLWERAGFDPATVPVRRGLLAGLQAERAAGRRVYLASGAPEGVVRACVAHFDVFVDGWGSTTERELVGDRKAEMLCERFGRGGFDYLGDSREDLAVWADAHVALVCWPRRALRRAAQRVAPAVRVIRRPVGATFLLAASYVVALVAQHPFRTTRAVPDTSGEPGTHTRDLEPALPGGGESVPTGR